MVAEFAFDAYISIDCVGASKTLDIKGYNGLGVGYVEKIVERLR
jgi:hypothetical protein